VEQVILLQQLLLKEMMVEMVFQVKPLLLQLQVEVVVQQLQEVMHLMQE
jgi:hypothetical protein